MGDFKAHFCTYMCSICMDTLFHWKFAWSIWSLEPCDFQGVTLCDAAAAFCFNFGMSLSLWTFPTWNFEYIFHRIVSNAVGTLRWDQCWQDFFDLTHKTFGSNFPNLFWTSTLSQFNFLTRSWSTRQLWSTFTLRKILLCHLQLSWTLSPSSSCIYFCQRGWNLLTLWKRTLKDLEEEGKLGTFIVPQWRLSWVVHIPFIPSHTRDFDCEEDDSSELFGL